MSRRFDLINNKHLRSPCLIGLAGRKRSGKDESARSLTTLSYVRDAFADDVKMIAHAMFPQVDLAAFSDDRKEQPIPGMGTTTPRDLAKAVGTGMRAIDPDYWVKRVLARIPTRAQTVITDVRFLNEVDAVHAAGGFVIRLNRADTGPVHEFDPFKGKDQCQHIYESESGDGLPGGTCDLPRTSHPCSWTPDRHQSETELPDDSALYDAVITADSAESASSQVLTLIQGFRS